MTAARIALGLVGKLGRPGAEGIGLLGRPMDGVESGKLPSGEAGNPDMAGAIELGINDPVSELVLIGIGRAVGRETESGARGALTGRLVGNAATGTPLANGSAEITGTGRAASCATGMARAGAVNANICAMIDSMIVAMLKAMYQSRY